MGTVDDEEDDVQATIRQPAGSLCHGVAWRDRRPYLELATADTGSAGPELVPLLHERLGIRAVAPGPFCLGYARAVDGGVDHVDCPNQAVASSGRQCDRCAARDDFRFVHHAHLGGYVPDALTHYLAQPHWVYVATFADATSKVGTASAPRKTSRLDEQGPARASQVAYAPDGRTARILEDAITDRAGIPQTKRRAAKAAALARPAAADVIEAEHREAVRQALEVASTHPGGAGVEVGIEVWSPPDAMAGLVVEPPFGGWPPYPHDLATGDHGFRVEAAAGPIVLARLGETSDTRYVADLDAVAGSRIARGPYSAPPTPIQLNLFSF